MKKLRVTSMRAQREELLEKLLVLGCVEVSEPDGLLTDPGVASLTSRETGALDKPKADYGNVTRALATLGRYAPVKSKMFAERKDVSASDFLSESDMDECVSLAERIERLDSRVRHTTAEEARLEARIESLLPWQALDIPLEHEGTRTSAVLLGSVPATSDFSELERALGDAAAEARVYKVSEGREQMYLCVIYLREKQEAVSEVLRSFSFTTSAPNGARGTAAENIEELRRDAAKLREERASLTGELVAAAEHRDALIRCADLLATKIDRAEAGEKFLFTDATATFEGWVPEPAVAELEKTLAEFVCEWELTDPAPEEYPNVPVKLKNNAVTSPLMMVTEMYSLPAYDGVDPNPLMAPFFIPFYGFMMADMGYGLLMVIAALLVRRKKPRGGMKTFFDLMLVCGISTFVFGALTGGFFGDSIQQLAGIFGKTFVLPYTPLFDPVSDATMILIIAFALGAVQIITGMAISLIHQIRTGSALDGVLDIVPWWVLFAGIALGALGVTWYVTIAGAVLIVATAGRSKPTVIGKITSGIGGLYNITAYFGDILSYARLMALMLAGGVIANVFNTLGAITGNVFTFLLIFVVGHALNMGLNLLGCYVHDLRLQCLEYFGKFYKDGGRPFRPLFINSKHINIINK
jgi:V/A-type H+-transporting ATPase subunit I